MSANLQAIGVHKVKSVFTGQSVELQTFWKDQDTLVIFFRRWGCMFCRLWAKELSEIAPILQKNKVKLIGVGVEETGAKEFAEGNFFDGELYYVEDINTYQTLGFKRFNIVSILTSLFWKQSRDAISKGRSMGLNSDLVGDGLQSGGALLLRRSGVPKHFIQNGVADHMPNMDIIEYFGLESEFKPETMTNQPRSDQDCPVSN